MTVIGPCLEWAGAKDQKGYGCVKVRGRVHRVHRLVFADVFGELPQRLVLDHLCRNRSCYNPLHLEPVSSRENTLRGEGPSSVNARKTHCVHGHRLDNAYVRNGRRICRKCRNKQQRRWRSNRPNK